jgi:signal transduction histidine kinase
VKRFIEIIGGTISLENSSSEGTTFIITLPGNENA